MPNISGTKWGNPTLGTSGGVVTWSLIGVFDIAAPIGRRCFQRYGNDLLVITVEGVYALSSILAVDTASQQRLSVPTANCSPWEIAITKRGCSR